MLVASLILSGVDLPLVEPTRFTAPVSIDADDPAIVERAERTIILGTDKSAAPQGGLYAFDLSGRVLAKTQGHDRPNNVDVIRGFKIGPDSVDLAVVTERFKKRLRIFRVGAKGELTDLTGNTDVFTGWPESDREPMGVTSASWGGVARVWISPKTGPKSDHFEMGELTWNPVTQRVDYKHTKRFGFFSGVKETEAMVVDPIEKRLYCADEGVGIWVFEAETGAIRGFISNPLHVGDHEGMALFQVAESRTLLSSDQREGANVFWAYHTQNLARAGGFRTGIDDTDGIEICAADLGPEFPNGILVTMNSKSKNFAIFDLGKVQAALLPRGKSAKL